MKIAISGSIVLYRSDKGLRQAVLSFLQTSIPVKLFLIDNSPTNIVQSEISDILNDARIVYIFNNRNLGFGAAHNIALKDAIKISKYHLVLNPDVYFKQGVLEKLYTFMEKNLDTGLVMPRVLYPDGRLQHLCKLLPTPMDLIFRRFLPEFLTQKKRFYYEMHFSQYNKEMQVPYLSGCFMFMRCNLLEKVGLFDERFFLYLEDIDLSRRFYIEAKNIYFPEVSIIHEHERGSYKNLYLLLIHSKSAFRYFNKWGWWFDKQRDKINKEATNSVKSQQLTPSPLKIKTA